MTYKVIYVTHYPVICKYYIVFTYLQVCAARRQRQSRQRGQLRSGTTYYRFLICFYPTFSLYCMSRFHITYFPPNLIMFFSCRFTLRLLSLHIKERARGEHSVFSGMAGATSTSSGAGHGCSTRSSQCSFPARVLSLFLG